MKFLAITAIAFGSLFTSVQAEDLISTWSTTAAWTPANQPDFTASSGGTLYTDESIAAGTNTSALNTDATLSLGTMTQGGNIYAGSYLYTGGSTPAFTLSTSNLLDDAQSITLSITAAYGVFTSNATTLSLGSSLASFTTVDTGASLMGSEVYKYTWTWDVSAASPYSSFNVTWTTPSIHTAYTGVQLTQSIVPVPEPREYALGLGALLVGLVVLRRRRARA